MNVLSIVAVLFGSPRFFFHWISAAEALKGHRQVFRFIRWKRLYHLAERVVPDLAKLGKIPCEARLTITALLLEIYQRAGHMGKPQEEAAVRLCAEYRQRFLWFEKEEAFSRRDVSFLTPPYHACVWGLGAVVPQGVPEGYELPRYFLDALPVPLIRGGIEEVWHTEFLKENGAVSVGGEDLTLAKAFTDREGSGRSGLVSGMVLAGKVQGLPGDPKRALLPVDNLEEKIDSMLEYGVAFELAAVHGQWLNFDGKTRILKHPHPYSSTYSGVRVIVLPAEYDAALLWMKERYESRRFL